MSRDNDLSSGFLSRWSQRKLQTRDDQELPVEAGLQEADELPADVPAAEIAAADEVEKLLTDEDMPPIESLTEASDYSGFMSEGVSEELRRLALRRLFRSAAFNVVDGLDDYDDDFTSFEKLGDIVTSDMRFQMEEEARKKMQAMLDDEDALEDMQDDVDADSQAVIADAAAEISAAEAAGREQLEDQSLKQAEIPVIVNNNINTKQEAE